MSYQFIISTFDTIGTLLIAWAALRVHVNVLKEHKIDRKVERAVKKEEWMFALGILLIITAFVLELLHIS